MIAENNIILDTIQIHQKIKRIAYQIYESNSAEKEVIIAGIVGNGFTFSKKIAKVLEEISSIKVTLCEVIIDKKEP
ncbi:MAG: pyrimidine operon attenuation protein/uracil phosphoribosyltransferase, partial [Patiriisocius sp.]